MTAPIWTLPQPHPEAPQLAAALACPEVIAHLLLTRNISTPEAAALYLNPPIDQLHDPFLMLGMAEAVTRIQQAVIAREPILIYGDYDVDGTTATVLLKTAIDRLSPNQPSLVNYHVPHRIREGYGMRESVLGTAADDGIRLVISVDTGIRAFAAATEARARNLDLIVTDHHLPDDNLGLPDALAVLNPNQHGDAYPSKDLCGAGVAFKLSQALLEASATTPEEKMRLRTRILPSFLKLLAIATIADSVPLLGENRVITSIGLRELRNPVQPGLRALMTLAKLAPATGFNATDVAFRLAPRINAAGRMDIASDVVDLFLTRDPARGQELAEKLHRLNDDRRATEAIALAAIEELLLTVKHETLGVVVVDGDGWHRGVIGILASRVVERTRRPALVIAHEEGVAHGSGRSIQGFHLLDAITAVDLEGPIFTRFGGHAHAVGFSLPSMHVPALRERLELYASTRVTESLTARTISCDANLALDQVTPELNNWLKKFEPFGHSNAEPTFIARNVALAAAPRILKEKHLRLRLRQSPTAPIFNCLCWSRDTNWAERATELNLIEGSLVNIVYKLRENTHPDFGGLELDLCDLQPAQL